ncbi:MAG: LysM peptidoglycan-binding domain-containing protein [Bacteroidales bacterium]
MRLLSLLISTLTCIHIQANDTIPSIDEPILPELPPTEISMQDTIQDSAIVIPEGLTSELDSMLTDWFLLNHTYTDSTCASGPYNPEYPDSVYIKRLGSLPTVMEMPYNPIVRSYINLYTQRKRNLVEYMLGLGNFYFPIFEEILDRENAPMELKYLPIIESALKPTARSRMGATGLWQFMLGTGKSLGLEINSLIDERCDPYKATEAAVRYLKQLHATYNDWNLAIAAYNCGPGNVNKAIRRAGGKTDYWQIYYYLPKETRGYVPAFIAATYVMNYYCEHNLCPVMTEIPAFTDTVKVNEMVHFEQISEKLNLPIEQLRMLNPQFRRDIVPGNVKSIALRLPVQQLYTFIEHKDTIVAYRATELLVNNRRYAGPGGTTAYSGSTSIHKVKSGETLGSIARKYHTNIQTLKKLNGLHSDRLRIGQQLVVNGNKIKTDKSPASGEQTASSYGLHTVKQGENLWTISQKYPGVTTDLIKKTNNLSSNNLKIGQRLRIPQI